MSKPAPSSEIIACRSSAERSVAFDAVQMRLSSRSVDESERCSAPLGLPVQGVPLLLGLQGRPAAQRLHLREEHFL
eukprot:1149079-Lingulodinium_polyedra.AAC.1